MNPACEKCHQRTHGSKIVCVQNSDLRKRVAVFCAVFFVFSFFATMPASAQRRALLTRHVRDAATSGFAPQVGVLPATQHLKLALMLPLRNQTALKTLLHKLSDPKNPLYRQWLTVQQFTDNFGPSQEDYDAVVHFAEANGMTVTERTPNRLLIGVDAPVANIESAFHLTLGTYQHPYEKRIFYAPDREPAADINVPLWHIAGLDNFSVPRPLYEKASSGNRNTTGSGPGGSFLGSDRRAVYYGGTALTGNGQTVGLVEFDGYALSDVQAYFNNVGQALNVTINNVLLDGASAGSDGDDTEQVIDIIEAISMAPSLSQVRVYIAPLSTVDSGGDVFIFNKMATENIAKQLSGSWNWSPADPTADDPIFQEFVAQGQTFVTASGDEGAYPEQPYFFPEEDANVTAVGGTDLTTVSSGGAWKSEIAWGGSNSSCSANTGSGGGPSPDGLTIPSYQQLAGVINSSNKGSTTLRNVPDVAAEANCDNYFCANGSCSEGLGGTSLAAPTWAGFIALVNQQEVTRGNPTIGFLNPTIYSIGVESSYSDYFHDITSGDNFNSDQPNLYPAVTGYDLVTGWGSPLGSGWFPATPASSLVLNWYDLRDQGFTIDNIVVSNPSASSTTASVTLDGLTQTLAVPAKGNAVFTFPDFTGGPALIAGSGLASLLASQRVIYNESFSEVNAVPSGSASTSLVLNYYDEKDTGFSLDNITLANAGSTSSTATVQLGTSKQNVTVPADGTAVVTFSGESGGPVFITSASPILVSRRTIYDSSFDEVSALPTSAASTSLVLNYYDEKDTGFSLDNITLANANSTSTTATVQLGTSKQNVTVPADGTAVVTFPGESGGPVFITSASPIFASRRTIYNSSFNEVNAVPTSAASTSLVLNYYDEKDTGFSLDNITLANASSTSTTATVQLGTSKQNVTIPADGTAVVTFSGESGGPVFITSASPIFASRRTIYDSSFHEVNAIPTN
jgi:hypothetical protein